MDWGEKIESLLNPRAIDPDPVQSRPDAESSPVQAGHNKIGTYVYDKDRYLLKRIPTICKHLNKIEMYADNYKGKLYHTF